MNETWATAVSTRAGAVLTVSLRQVEHLGDSWRACLRLEGYRPRRADIAGLELRERRGFESARSARSLGLIEQWAIDPDFDGGTFRPCWQRQRQHSGAAFVEFRAPLACAVFDRPRLICVRAADVFGRESEGVLRIDGLPERDVPEIRLEG